MARCLRSTDGFFDGGGVTPSPTPTLQFYKRTYGAVQYLVDVDGKLVTDDTVYVEVGASGNPDACVLSLCSTNTDLSDIVAAWGKTTAVFSSQELGTTDYTITIGDDFVEIEQETANPAIESFTPAESLFVRTDGNNRFIVDQEGKVIKEGDICLEVEAATDAITYRNAHVAPAVWGVSSITIPGNSTTVVGDYTCVMEAGQGTITPFPENYG